MPKRLAITIAGAVSLGSYEAGVLFEVLDAISLHNAAAASDDDKVVIDVLTGASAGGMTAIIVAQKILYSAGEFVGPYDNPLYNTWVKRISLAGLQATQTDEPALHSLFSSDLITQISNETLMTRYAGRPLTTDPHAAAAAELRVGVALTNLNGVAYGYAVEPGGKFTYVDHSDQLTRHIVPAPADNAAFWEPLRQAAVACGAFPIAFRPQDMERSAKLESEDYPSDNLEPWPNDPMTMTYCDGGVLQNQPLGMAKNLVDYFDEHLHQESRFFLFVSPHAKDPAATDKIHAADMNYFELVKALVTVVVGQAGFKDWVTARNLNERIALLDNRAAGLKNAMLAGTVPVAPLAQTADAILGLFFPAGVQCSPGARAEETLAAAKTRIGTQYAQEMLQLAGIPAAPEAFRDSVLAFESAAGLGAHDAMTIYGITAMNTELAGGGVEAFLGFFDQRFRDHDYDLGRTKARAVLNDPAVAGLGLAGYAGSAINQIDATLDGLKWGDVPQADRTLFENGLKARTHQMLTEGLGRVEGTLAIPFANLAVDELVKHL